MQKVMSIEEPPSDKAAINIDKKLKELPLLSFDHCIYRVPDQLRKVNEKAYEPQVISIGPYYNGKRHLEAMEEHKLRFLQMFLDRYNKNVAELVQRLRTVEDRAGRCYARPVDLDTDKFMEMMILDGCFVVHLICCHLSGLNSDPIFQIGQIFGRLMQDLLLVENQLPFFVLMELFKMTNNEMQVIEGILCFFEDFSVLPGKGHVHDKAHYTDKNIDGIKHLLALIHENWQPPPSILKEYEKTIEDMSFIILISNLLEELSKENNLNDEKEKINNQVELKTYIPRCATELKEAGIKFKEKKFQHKNKVNVFDISFDNGVIKIPKIKIVDSTERIMRNLIAYEQQNPVDSPKYVTEYMAFMDSLINSEKDVEILSRNGIIENWLGDDKTVAALFNKIGDEVFFSRALYADIRKRIHNHFMKRRNKWIANLRHSYFHTPWTSISVVAATILLLFTGAQTLFSLPSFK